MAPQCTKKEFENLVSNSAPIILQTAIIYIHNMPSKTQRIQGLWLSGASASASEKEKEIGGVLFFWGGFYQTAEAT